jgi:GntR family transcriptional regulator
MEFSVSKEPLYIRVKRIILEAIHSGKLGKDNRLPSEKVLAEKFNVSRATIRSALQSLEDDSIIKKQQGVGTFLTPQNHKLKMRIDKVKGFYQLIEDSGRTPSIREEGISRESISEKISDHLNVPPNTEVLILKRTFMGDGEPAIHVREYIPVTLLNRDPSSEEIPESIFEFADKFCPERIEYSISEIIPTIVDVQTTKTMGLAQKKPILKLEEIHFTRNDVPIIFSEVFVNDHIIRFNVFRTRDRL